MNWKIIFQLSLFGLIMAFATVSLIPEKVEPVFWVAIFVFGAWVIAKVCNGKYFLHGFLVSMVNSIWITLAHAIFRETYLAHHSQLSAFDFSLTPSITISSKTAMVLMAPVFGVLFGIIQGLFAYIASKIIKRNIGP